MKIGLLFVALFSIPIGIFVFRATRKLQKEVDLSRAARKLHEATGESIYNILYRAYLCSIQTGVHPKLYIENELATLAACEEAVAHMGNHWERGK